MILETLECGIELKGCEVKSLREHNVSLKDSFARIDNNEAFLYNTHISPYEKAGRFNPETKRVRKLLLHRKQINKLIGESLQKGFALIPICVYLKGGLIKVELGICKGKRLYDKREDIKKDIIRREIEREMKEKGGERYRLR